VFALGYAYGTESAWFVRLAGESATVTLIESALVRNCLFFDESDQPEVTGWRINSHIVLLVE
jgi:hypothetical protein